MVAFPAPAALANATGRVRACGAVRSVSIHGTPAVALLDWGGQPRFDLLARAHAGALLPNHTV